MFKIKRYNPENQINAWLFLAPALILILIFSIYPLFRSFYLSFHSGFILNQHFSGIDNYVKIFNDPIFIKSLLNTALFAIVVVPIALVISLFISWAIFEKVKFKAFFETIFFMPYVTSVIAIGMVFQYFFNKNFGVINFVLALIGIPNVNWLDNPSMSMPTLIIFGVWSSLAFNIIILLSGFRNINPEYYTIADMFGASKWEQFRKITLPQLMPTLSFLLTVNLISAFKVYTEVFALFGGQAGIANSAVTAVFYVYNKFYNLGQSGPAMAASVVLFAIIILMTILQRTLISRRSRGGK
ncbi:MAG: sugar ABC transporter permease [Streptococcaceae bacterium]|jgi:multiple sugar transport system permease protein|nr:sugar ABC transporter permease [Streptococcaceae bacterium]